MTLTQLLAQCRVYLQDPAGTRWPDAELTQWLNEAQDELCIATDATQADALLDINAKAPANAFYSLPSDLVSLTAIKANGVTLPALSLAHVETWDDWETETGEPIGYLYGPYGQTVIRLFPYQAATVKAFYIYRPVQLVSGADVPEVLSIYHPTIVHGAVAKAYAKDFDAKDPTKVAYHRAEYERGVGMALAQRNSPPTFVPYRHL